MSLIKLLKFKTWETMLFKMPRLETPHFQTRCWVTVSSGQGLQLFLSSISYANLAGPV